MASTGMYSHRAAEHIVRPVDRIGMYEWSDAARGIAVSGVLALVDWALEFVILAAHGQRDAVPGRHHHRRRPDLDLHLVDLTGLERLCSGVRVVRTERLAQAGVHPSVRRPQPALRNWGMRVHRSAENHLRPEGVEDPEHQEEI